MEARTPATVNLAPPGLDTTLTVGGRVKVLITRDGGDPSLDMTVFLKLKGTAVNGTDYALAPNTVVIPAGKTAAKLKTVEDTLPRGTRSTTVKLAASPTSDYVPGATTKVKLLLLDNE